ncbi:MAG: hypothetical protein ACOY93_02835 [Bacillota bacterium]
MRDPGLARLLVLCSTVVMLALLLRDANLLTHFVLYGFGYLSGKGPDKWGKA